MKTHKYLNLLATCLIGLTLTACGGGGGGGGSDSSSSDSGYYDDYDNSADDSNSNNSSSSSKPTTPAYTGWAPKDLKGYTIKFNKKFHNQDTFYFDSNSTAESNTGNICILSGYKWVNDNTATFEKLFVSRRRYGTDEQDSLAAFSFENVTLHFTSANRGTLSGADVIYANGGFYAGSGINSFTISK